MSNIRTEAVKQYDYDVAVIGSGSGGIAAAVAAARNGCRVLVLEKNGYVGGMTTAGLPYLGYLDVKKRPTVGGLAIEFVERLKQDNASFGVRYCPKHCSIAAIDPDKVKIAAASFLEENGVDFLLHTNAIEVEVVDGVLKSILCECAGTRLEVRAKIFVDATGDGVISYLAGAEYEKGTAGVDLQPPSILFTIGGVDKERFFEWLEEHPEEVEPYTMEYLRAAPDFVLVTLQKLWAKLNPIGEWPMGIWAMIYINRFNDSEVCINGPRMAATDATDPQSITQAEILGQRQAVAFIEMLRKYVPGFEKAFLSHINDSIGVRETRRIVGYKTLRIDDVKAGATGDDTIALGSYPIDIHGSKDYSSQFIHVDEPYGIPYLTTVCKTVGGLMMAGRCISVDREAYGSCRVMGTCFAVGEAVGIGAALSIKHGCRPEQVDVKEIREILLQNGALLSV